MYIKVINPATHGRNAYANTGSARQATNYLEGEAKKQQQQAIFFNAERSVIQGKEAVLLLDSNHKGLRKSEAKFYSLVISPSPQELDHIGHDPQKLRQYTTRVMQEYAATVVPKSGNTLREKDLLWVATQHNERRHRGYDGAPSGQKKEGPQTHIHVLVSARDKAQQLTLNPLGRIARFNRVTFMARSIVAFEAEFGPLQHPLPGRRHPAVDGQPTRPTAAASRPRRAPTAEEVAHFIHYRAAARQGRAAFDEFGYHGHKPAWMTDDSRDKQLGNLLQRVNQKRPADHQLEQHKVLDIAREQAYSNGFYGRLHQLGREKEPHPLPYEFLRTGKDATAATKQLATDQKRTQRLLQQVARLNTKLPAEDGLDPQRVVQLAHEQHYSKAFYGRLSRLNRQAQGPLQLHDPHEFLRTGRVPRPTLSLPAEPPTTTSLTPSATVRSPTAPTTPSPSYPRAGSRAVHTHHPAAAPAVAQIDYALSIAGRSQGYTRDARGDQERD